MVDNRLDNRVFIITYRKARWKFHPDNGRHDGKKTDSEAHNTDKDFSHFIYLLKKINRHLATTFLPKGAKLACAILKQAMPAGMPMIVQQ